ncbi:hypothetical protein AAH450_07940 [Erwinia sp. P7711]|uniref:hypothetical protein n=1 Tax=Erwinia sp. P7711 TaxID=3141451 RepID=UPI00318AFE2A
MTEELCRAKFEEWVADELGHTLEYVKGQRAVTTDRYYSEYVEIPYRAWKAAWNTRAEMEKSDENA